MVALYGFTQMAGPWLTKQWLEAGGTLAAAFGIGVAALAFGLAFGTVLTLFVVPVLYAIFFKIGPDETAAEPQGAS